MPAPRRRKRVTAWRPNWPSPTARWSSAAAAALEALEALRKPLAALSRRLEAVLEDAPDWLDAAGAGAGRRRDCGLGWRRETLARLDCAAWRGSAGRPIPSSSTGWRSSGSTGANMTSGIASPLARPDPSRWPTPCWSPPHGVLVTRATLRGGEDWAAAEARTGAIHLPGAPRTLRSRQPVRLCGAGRSADRHRHRPRRYRRARRGLCPADRGGGRRDTGPVHRDPAAEGGPCADRRSAGARRDCRCSPSTSTRSMRAPWSIFFATIPAPRLLGTDALRDGVDVPGESLRLVVMERVPWPRPTVLHAARRLAGGRQRL